ncbi:MAG: PIN domain-containing protein [bacterium]|nr:PIN domain-containing protein [bacterium]
MHRYFVADTHAFLWYLADDSRLSKKAGAVFELSEQGHAVIIIPAIVLLESIDIIDKKKIDLDFEKILFRITQAGNFAISELNTALIWEVNKIKGFKDLHDRIIVATAQTFGAALISKDKMIKKFYPEVVW